jgi:hypothetical protein
MFAYEYGQPIVMRIKFDAEDVFWVDGPPPRVLCADADNNGVWVALIEANILNREPKYEPQKYAVIVNQKRMVGPANEKDNPQLAGHLIRLNNPEEDLETLVNTMDTSLQTGESATGNVHTIYHGSSGFTIGKDRGISVRYNGEDIVHLGDREVNRAPSVKQYLPGEDNFSILKERSWVLQLLPRAFIPGFNTPHIWGYLDLISKATAMTHAFVEFARDIRSINNA